MMNEIMKVYRFLRILRNINIFSFFMNVAVGLYYRNWVSIISFLSAIYCFGLAIRIHKLIGTEIEAGTVET